MKTPEEWPTEEMVRAFKKVFRRGSWNEGVIAGIKAALAAAPTPPAPEVEPVAWHVKRAAFKQYNNGGEFYGRDEAFFNAGFDAGCAHHPANDGLRKAAEEIHTFLAQLKPNMHNWLTTNEYMHLMENLRNELNKGKS